MVRNPNNIFTMASNFKVGDLLLAMGNGQLERLEEKKQHLLNVYKLYEDGLKESKFVDLIPIMHEQDKIPLCIDLKTEHRKKLEEFLMMQDIQISKFHRPVHTASYLGNFNPKSFPNKSKILRARIHAPLRLVKDSIIFIELLIRF